MGAGERARRKYCAIISVATLVEAKRLSGVLVRISNMTAASTTAVTTPREWA